LPVLAIELLAEWSKANPVNIYRVADMRQIGPAGSISFNHCASLIISKAQPGVPSDMAIVAILILVIALKVRSIQKSHGWNRFWSRTLDVKDENLCYLFSFEKCPVA
jgi:hypothetical protein